MKVFINTPVIPELSVPTLILQPDNERDQAVLQRLVDNYDFVGCGRDVNGVWHHVELALKETE